MEIVKNINSFNSFYKFVKDIYENGFEIFLSDKDDNTKKHKLFRCNFDGEDGLSSAIGFNVAEKDWDKFNIKVHYDWNGVPVKLTLDNVTALETEYFIFYGVNVVVSNLQWREKKNDTTKLPSIIFASIDIRNGVLIHEDYIPFDVSIKIMESYRRLLTDIPKVEKCSMIHGLANDKIMNFNLSNLEYVCNKHGHVDLIDKHLSVQAIHRITSVATNFLKAKNMNALFLETKKMTANELACLIFAHFPERNKEDYDVNRCMDHILSEFGNLKTEPKEWTKESFKTALLGLYDLSKHKELIEQAVHRIVSMASDNNFLIE